MWQRGLKASSNMGRSLPLSPFTVTVVLGQLALTAGAGERSSSWGPSRGEGPLPQRSVQHWPPGCGAVWVWRYIPVPTSSSLQAASPTGWALVEMSVLPQVGKQGHDEVVPEEPAWLDDNPRASKINEEKSFWTLEGQASFLRRDEKGNFWPKTTMGTCSPLSTPSECLPSASPTPRALDRTLAEKTTTFPLFSE